MTQIDHFEYDQLRKFVLTKERPWLRLAIWKHELLAFIERLKSDRRLTAFDEAKTKQIVLLRILSLLNWDVYDIDEVLPEYAVGSQRVDFALRHSNVNKVFIEVKKIGEDLEKHQEQLLNYSFKEGVKLAILTNGISWRFYLPLHEGSWEQRKFYTIEIYDQSPTDIVGRFADYLAKENVNSGKAIENAETVYKGRQKEYLTRETLPKAWNKLISEPDEFLIELIADATEKMCGYKPSSSAVEAFIATNVQATHPIVGTQKQKEIVKAPQPTAAEDYVGKSVSAFVFKNTKHEIKYWIELLTQLCRLMYQSHRGEFDRVLQLRGSKRPYFTKNRNELRAPQRVEDSDIFMETNLSSTSIVKISRSIIALFGYLPHDLTIESH